MKRRFSFALALAMCLTTLLGSFTVTLAEEEEALFIGAVDQEVAQAGESDMDIGDLGGDDAGSGSDYGEEDDYGEDTGLSTDGAESVEGDLDALYEAAGQEAAGDDYEIGGEDGTGDDPVEGASEGGDAAETFTPWYASAIVSLTLEMDETISCTVPEGSVLLVTGMLDDGRLNVACDGLTGAVEAGALLALTSEEYDAFMELVSSQECVLLFQDDPNYPLPPMPTAPQAETTIPGDDPVDDQAGDADAVEGETPEEDADAPGDDSEGEGTDAPQGCEKAEENEDENGEEPGEPDDAAEKGEEKPSDAEGEDGEATSDEEKKEDESEDEAEKKEEGEAGAEDAQSAEAAQASEAEAQTPAPEDAASGQPVEQHEGAESGVPTAVAVNRQSLTLGVKEVYTGLTATVVDGNGAAVEGRTVTWRSSNVRVVRVNAAGRLTAVRNGKATVVVASEGLPEVLVPVYVKSAPSSVSLTPKKGRLSIGMGLPLTAKLNKGAACGQLTYVSSNPGVATVDENGVVTGVGLGRATITVRTFNKKRARCNVTVSAEPASITTDKPAYAVLHGTRQKIAISILDGAGAKTYAGLNITSSDPNCVTVDANGNVTGVNLGTATVTITTHNGLSTSCTVDVCGLPADMALSADTITIGVKEKYRRMSYTLIPPEGQEKCAAIVTWKSKNKKIAKVNAKTGVITGVKAGTTTIIATTNNKISKRLKVVVKKAPKSVTLSPKELGLTVGMAGQLVASYNAKNVNNNITYTSSDPGIVTVDENGLVTAVGRGSATITGKTYNGKRATCTVNVYNDPAQVMVNESITVAVGASAQLSCSVVDADGQPSMADYTYAVEPESGSVDIDGSGRITGVSVGTARIRVTTHNGVSTHLDGAGNPVETVCLVTIVEAPPVRYRMFAAYSYFNVPQKGSLTFPMNNATSFQHVLSGTTVDGKIYENMGIMENPDKNTLLTGIVNAFSDSVDTDINVVYLCSHGFNRIDVPKTSKSTHYGLQLPGYLNYRSSNQYYITSEEIFDAISSIKGKVILVLDSCYSGQFIANMKSALNNAGGRISVMTAASNTRACYYNVSDVNRACDYFTLYLLMGAGYDMRNHAGTGSYPADSNADGKLTFSEMFSYAKKSVKNNVPKLKNKSTFHGDPAQSPNVYTGGNGDLVLFQYA